MLNVFYYFFIYCNLKHTLYKMVSLNVVIPAVDFKDPSFLSSAGSLRTRNMAATRHLGSVEPQRVISAIIPTASNSITESIDPFTGIPKLPPSLATTQQSFLENVESGNVSNRSQLNNEKGDVSVNVISDDNVPRDLLEQYNKLVAEENTVKYTTPFKLSFYTQPPTKNMSKKARRTVKRHNSVFTAGISSISKPQRPSFAVPRESVNRANLPRSVMVEQMDDQFAFGLKSKKEKHSDLNIPKYKQMRVFGLDSFPTIDLERYISNALMQTGIRGNTKVKVGYGKKNYPRRLEPIRHSSETGGGVARDFHMEGSLSKGRNAYTSGGEDGFSTSTTNSRTNVLSFGNSLGESDHMMRRMLRNSYPSQYDWKLRQQDMYRRSKFEARDNTVSGICSLAPIQMGNNGPSPSNYYSQDQDNKRRSRNASIDGDTVFESELESLLNTTGFKVQENERNGSALSHGSYNGRPNPPPSISSDEGDLDTPLPRFPKITIPLPPELSNLTVSTTSKHTQPTESKSSKSRMENLETFSEYQNQKTVTTTPSDLYDNVPNVYVQNIKLDLSFVKKDKDFKTEKKITSSRKGAESVASKTPINLTLDDAPNSDRKGNQMMINGNTLKIPFVDNSTPTLLTDRPEGSKYDAYGSKISESSGDARPVSDFSAPLPRVAVQTLNPFPKLGNLKVARTPAVSVTFNSGEKQTIQESHNPNDASVTGENKTEDSESAQKQLVVNNKTLQFISPLKVQSNAKRQ